MQAPRSHIYVAHPRQSVPRDLPCKRFPGSLPCSAWVRRPIYAGSYNERVLLSEFDYDLPEDRIAQTPLTDRAASRMLVVDRASGRLQDRHFRDLPAYLRPSDRLVLNNTRVLPARLFGRRAGVHATTSKSAIRGLVEILLLRQVQQDPARWQALVRPGRKMRMGERIRFPEDIEAEIVERGDYGFRVIEFSLGGGNFAAWLERVGHMPLPPYIKRSDDITDRERYQTVFAERPGAVAAPTAGLHFTPRSLTKLDQAGVQRVVVTLHVGLGTFQPVRTDKVDDHPMHAECYEICPRAAEQLQGPGRRVAVGTTVVRLLEHVVRASPDGKIEAGQGETNLFILPGFEFRAVDALLTNFHLPRSTLLMLVCAFAGRELTLEAYRHAVKEHYRFYSYGDCMLII